MLRGRPFQDGDTGLNDEERARIQARLQALGADQSDDGTRRIGSDHEQARSGHGGGFAGVAATAPSVDHDVETRAYLLTIDGGLLAEIPCNEEAGAVVIGRGKAAGIRIEDAYVHRHHAELRWDAGERAHFIIDGGGENGTFVNRHRVRKPFRLVGGEQLRFGRTKLVYRIRR